MRILPQLPYLFLGLEARYVTTVAASFIATAGCLCLRCTRNTRHPFRCGRTNPVKPTPESQAHAKKIWGYDCALCHGEKGDGKGDVADSMKLTLKDYTKPDSLKDITDGQMYDIILKGKGQMPGEEGRAKPDDIWNLIIYIRNMSKK